MPVFPTRNRRGNYMMMMGGMLPIFVGFSALSIDISYINMAATQAQHVADAASHAAFIGFRSTNDFTVGNDAADFILAENLIGNAPGALTQPIEYGEWNFDNQVFTPNNNFVNAARAVVARSNGQNNPLDLFFAPLLGYDQWDVAGMGVTAGRTRQIIIVQDVSGSFADDIDNSRDADVAFLNFMANNPYPDDRLGLTLFGGRTWYPVLQPLAPVAGNYIAAGNAGNGKPNSMLARFQAVDYCSGLASWSDPRPDQNIWGGNCYTTQARGLIQARDEFVNNGDEREFQAVILISDGHPNVGLQSGANNGKQMTERAANQLWGKDSGGADARNWDYEVYECDSPTGACGDGQRGDHSYNTFFNGGVHIWTVTFKNGGGNFDWMGSLVKGMGRAYETPDASELEGIMVEIASSIPVVLTE